VFPSLGVTAMFGVTSAALLDPLQLWSVAGRLAATLVDFGRIEGRIDAAAAREKEAYEAWRKSVLGAIEDVEAALTTVARAKEQRQALQRAREHAGKSLAFAERRFKAGESSLLDVLDSQRQVIEADSALTSTETLYAGAIVALYQTIGSY
jgi:outer membrane protein TolC